MLYRYNLFVSDVLMTDVNRVATALNVSAADLTRKGMGLMVSLRELELSGAAVKGVWAETTSGKVWVGKGL